MNSCCHIRMYRRLIFFLFIICNRIIHFIFLFIFRNNEIFCAWKVFVARYSKGVVVRRFNGWSIVCHKIQWSDVSIVREGLFQSLEMKMNSKISNCDHKMVEYHAALYKCFFSFTHWLILIEITFACYS